MFSSSDHTFVVCAYKESPFLKDCLQSLAEQTIAPNIVMVTSTPNDSIHRLSEQHSVPLVINDTEPGIASDWNNAVESVDTKLVTIAHQDDLYCPRYLESLLDLVSTSDDPLLYFTDYGELRNGTEVNDNKLLRVKRFMLSPLKAKATRKSKFIRRRILSFGSPICCPSVTLVKSKLTPGFFKADFHSDLDWQAWTALAGMEGDFLYNTTIQMYHRIHEDSETSRLIQNASRGSEDLQMLQCFWPKPIASLIYKLYAKGQDSNEGF